MWLLEVYKKWCIWTHFALQHKCVAQVCTKEEMLGLDEWRVSEVSSSQEASPYGLIARIHYVTWLASEKNYPALHQDMTSSQQDAFKN